MKRLLIGAMALVLSLGSFAQAKSDLTPQERAESLTEKMKTQLELTDAQVQQVAPLNLKMAQDIDLVDRNDPSAEEKIEKIKADYQRDLEKVLTAEQAKKAKEMGEKRRQMRKKPKW